MASFAPFDKDQYPSPGKGDIIPTLLDTPPDKKNTARVATLIVCIKDEKPVTIKLEEACIERCTRPLCGIRNGLDWFLKATCSSWDRLRSYYSRNAPRDQGPGGQILFQVDHPMPKDGYIVYTAILFTGEFHVILLCSNMKMYYKPEF